MGKNIFSMFQGYVPKPKRNVFDLSFNNNFTTKFGQLTPVLCKEVVPGDSFKIETAAGLRLMPMAYPVQTPMKAYVHYFYVRNRALWKDWQDFITGTKDNLVPPYIDLANYTSDEKKEFLKVGGIADYFGVPNVVYQSEGTNSLDSLSVDGAVIDIVTDTTEFTFRYSSFVTTKWVDYSFLHYLTKTSYDSIQSGTDSVVTNLASITSDNIYGTTAFSAFSNLDYNYTPNPYDVVKTYNTDTTITNSYVLPWSYLGSYTGENFVSGTSVTFTANYYKVGAITSGQVIYKMPIIKVVRNSNRVITSVTGSLVDLVANEDAAVGSTYAEASASFSVDVLAPEGSSVEIYTVFPVRFYKNSDTQYTIFSMLRSDSIEVEYGVTSDSIYNVIGDGSYTSTPYDSDLQLSALPFRAYECIYNSYYRNMQNNPYILDGVEEYNKFIPSNEGGADTNSYQLRQRNWEYDFMTSAVPSPQFGVAPLVGITMTGTATFQDENGTTYYAQAELDNDGTITGWSTHSSNMPAGTLRMLMDNVGTGISINDLRNVNSFQRFLENSLRVGLKYRDQIKGHFGVDVRYDELEMPEFIGGMSLDINVNQVTQTADVSDSSYPLAGFAGQAGAFGSSKHAVTKYCDEHGFIIGILSVVPVPVYSQLLPKFFIKNEMLDYYYPEFGHIGYQPILQKEISPLQSYYTNSDLNDVFGYQRAWYDYIASTDEVHSQFRTTLRDFVMNRTFENVPALNESFLLVDPDQVNDVFLVTSDGEYGPDADKILGQLYFKITKKSPIPILGIPRLTD